MAISNENFEKWLIDVLAPLVGDTEWESAPFDIAMRTPGSETALQKLLGKLGVGSLDELEKLPNAKEAAKLFTGDVGNLADMAFGLEEGPASSQPPSQQKEKPLTLVTESPRTGSKIERLREKKPGILRAQEERAGRLARHKEAAARYVKRGGIPGAPGETGLLGDWGSKLPEPSGPVMANAAKEEGVAAKLRDVMAEATPTFDKLGKIEGEVAGVGGKVGKLKGFLSRHKLATAGGAAMFAVPLIMQLINGAAENNPEKLAFERAGGDLASLDLYGGPKAGDFLREVQAKQTTGQLEARMAQRDPELYQVLMNIAGGVPPRPEERTLFGRGGLTDNEVYIGPQVTPGDVPDEMKMMLFRDVLGL